MWGITGITRMFNSEIGGQIAWLIPTALIFMVGLLWLSRRMPRTDGRRAAVILWGSWLVVTGVVFDFMSGIFHPYYTVALAPAIGALVGIGAVSLWKAHQRFAARALLAAGIAAAAIWGYDLLHRTSAWHPWLRFAVLMAGLAVAGYVLVMPRISRLLTVAAATLALFVGLAGPFAYSVSTAATGKSGAIPSAGPAGQGFGFGGRGGPGGNFGALRQRLGQLPQGAGGGNFGGLGGRGGGAGGLLDASTPSAALKAALLANAKDYTWVAATVGSNNAAGLQLATGKAVMAIGGFNGTDPSPTLAQFEKWVSEGKIHYFIGGSGFGGGGGFGGGSSGTSSQIESWVTSHFQATTIGGQTVYDLTTSSGA
jgi:4-amino-4-deoxy-L-arabinose transferase-like glycosyltransferase